VYGAHDDQTPATIASDIVTKLGNRNITVVFSPVAQHHGFVANDVCHVGFEQLQKFDTTIWAAMDKWITRTAKMAMAATR